MSHKIIRSLLEARLKAWAAARTPALRIAYQNVAFTPSNNEIYLRAFLIPAAPTVTTWPCAPALHRGVSNHHRDTDRQRPVRRRNDR